MGLLELLQYSNTPIWTYPVVAVLVFLLWEVTQSLFLHRLNAVPGPLAAKLFSSYLSLADLKGERAQTLAQLHSQYGPVVRIAPNKVSIGDWKAYREIYSTSKASSKDPEFYGAAKFINLDNIFSMQNHAQHAARRKLVATPYSLQSIASHSSMVSEKAEVLVQRLIADAQSQGAANAYELCSLFSFEVVCKLAFNKDFKSTERNECLRLLKAMDGSAPLILIDSVMPFIGTTGLGLTMPGFVGNAYRAKRDWEKGTREMVEDLVDTDNEKDAFLLAPLVKGVDSYLGRPVNREELVEEAMGIMFAGSGTTSTTLVYMLYALSRPSGQAIQDKLRLELEKVPDNLQDVRSLPYLNAVIKETFRLYPTIISTLPRILDVDFSIGKYMLPAKTQVGMQNYVHHRDPAVFANPTEFHPERWLKGTKDMENALTPFSVGPYNCIGQNLAWAELYLATSKIVRSMKVSLASSMSEADMEMEDRFNIAPKSRKLNLEVTRI